MKAAAEAALLVTGSWSVCSSAAPEPQTNQHPKPASGPANMLGVRREGVTEGAMKLQRAGLIRYVRGHITVLDRSGLERRTCECYAVVKAEYDRLLPALLAT
jgi:hypothetical protein